MLNTLAIDNYRSIRSLVVSLGQLNVITGANGAGKSNLYRALLLLAETARGGVVQALAQEGGLRSTFWAGPEMLTPAMRSGEVLIQGGPRQEAQRLRLGFVSESFSYTIALGIATNNYKKMSLFKLDPEVKHESIWVGPFYRSASALIDRDQRFLRARVDRDWREVTQQADPFQTMFAQFGDPKSTPEIFELRDSIRAWRFYDHFRTDRDAPARSARLGTRTPVLHQDGRDLGSALQTIVEDGDAEALHAAVAQAFPGSSVEIFGDEGGPLHVEFDQRGLLRPLSIAELSDGTLRYLLWIAALLTPSPPPLMVLNEPETSLHPELLPSIARLIIDAAQRTQVWVISHSAALVAELKGNPGCTCIELEKDFGETRVVGQRPLDAPRWQWPDK